MLIRDRRLPPPFEHRAALNHIVDNVLLLTEGNLANIVISLDRLRQFVGKGRHHHLLSVVLVALVLVEAHQLA